MPRPFARIALSTALALAAACVDDPDAAELDLGVDDAALTGAATTARPGIGRVHRDGSTASCAATLVAPQLILTGDGCIGNRTSSTPFAGATFHFVDAGGTRRLLRVIETIGFRDLAFGRLEAEIPSTQASPIAFAVTTPRSGHQVSAFGWLNADVTQKRVQTFNDDGVELTSPITFEANDSGAPHVWGTAGANGDVWGIAVRGSTPFAKYLTQYQRHLEAQVSRWSWPHVYGWDRPGMDYRTITNSVFAVTDYDCDAACGEDPKCRAWTLNHDTNTCYLKDGVPPLRPSIAAAVSGLASTSFGGRFDGNDLSSLTTTRRDQCAQACGANAQCQAYSWERPTGFCVLKSAAGTKLFSETWESGFVVRSELGTDRPGSDYAFDTVADRPACTQLCAGDARCLAFSYVESSRGCWRKDGVPWATRTTGIQSGRKLGLNYNVDYSGGDYRTFTTTATDPASTCQATCARESQCKAWSLSEATSTPTCHLKSSIGGTSFKPRIVSGLKGLEFTAGLAP